MMTMGRGHSVVAGVCRAGRRRGAAGPGRFCSSLRSASLMLFTRSFEAVLDFIQFSLLFCSFFTVLGVHQAAHHPGLDLPRTPIAPGDTR